MAGRDNKLTKGLFRSTKAVSTSPVANLLLVHLMHGSTLVYTKKGYGVPGLSEVRRPLGPPRDVASATFRPTWAKLS